MRTNTILLGLLACALFCLSANDAQGQSTTLADYVLYATEDLSFKGGLGPGGLSEINGGHVGVQLIDTNDPVLAIGVNHPVTMADGTEVVANSMRINSNTSVWDIYVNTFYGTGDPVIRNLGPTAFDASVLPGLPTPPDCTPGVDDVTADPGTTINLPAGDYNNLNPKDGSTVILHAGIYNFRTILCGQNVSIVLEPGTEIRVAERVALNDGYCVVGRDGLPVSDVKFWVCGEGLGPTDVGFHFGKDGVFNGAVCVANGIIALGNGTQICGSVWGVTMRSDLGVIVNPADGCACDEPISVEDSTWGSLKSLYR